jgi:hypothetical protein
MRAAPRLWSAGLTLLLLAGACDTGPAYLQEEGRRRHLQELGVERFDAGGDYRLAGVSAVRTIAVEPVEPGELGADTTDGAFGLFSMRCGACHEPPSPGSKPSYLWAPVMSRMKKNAQDAGLMPPSADDEALILDFLQRHAADRP